MEAPEDVPSSESLSRTFQARSLPFLLLLAAEEGRALFQAPELWKLTQSPGTLSPGQVCSPWSLGCVQPSYN